MAMQLKEGEYRARQFGCGHSNSGPAGRRKTRPFNLMRQAAADEAGRHTIVLFCTDQHRSNGTGCIGKAVRDLGPNALRDAARLAGEAMQREFVREVHHTTG